VISYADVAYQFQANTAEYCDKSHAAYYGRQGSPLTSQMHSVGISTLSQALRIAATRTREECGGVTPMEWRNARTASWQTTLLGLGQRGRAGRLDDASRHSRRARRLQRAGRHRHLGERGPVDVCRHSQRATPN
jgi:hypothetical protein